MTNEKRPMLAEKYVESKLRFEPFLYASHKVDGYRCFVHDCKALTRSGKDLPNLHVRTILSDALFNGMDGELVSGAWNDPATFDTTSSAIRKASGAPDFTFLVFDDRSNPALPYTERMQKAQSRVIALRALGLPVVFLEQHPVHNLEELAMFETGAIEDGYEGVILRGPESPYKFGRGTVEEGYILKVKRRESREAVIIGFEERMLNENEAFTDELGKTKRSTKAEGRVPSGMIGAVIMRNRDDWPTDFKVGAGKIKHDKRKEMWENQPEYIGQTGTYSFLPHGDRPVPREGIFHGVRGPEDLGG